MWEGEKVGVLWFKVAQNRFRDDEQMNKLCAQDDDRPTDRCRAFQYWRCCCCCYGAPNEKKIDFHGNINKLCCLHFDYLLLAGNITFTLFSIVPSSSAPFLLLSLLLLQLLLTMITTSTHHC